MTPDIGALVTITPLARIGLIIDRHIVFYTGSGLYITQWVILTPEGTFQRTSLELVVVAPIS